MEGWETWSLFIIYPVLFLKPLYHLACLCRDQMIVLSTAEGGVWKPTAVAALPFSFKLEKPQPAWRRPQSDSQLSQTVGVKACRLSLDRDRAVVWARNLSN